MGMHRASAAYAWFRQPKCVSDGRQPGGTRLEKPEWAPSALQQNDARFVWMVHPPNDYGMMGFDSPNESSFNMPRWLLSGVPVPLFTIRKIWIMISPKLFSREPPRRTPLFDQKLWVLPKIGGTGSLANWGENIWEKKESILELWWHVTIYQDVTLYISIYHNTRYTIYYKMSQYRWMRCVFDTFCN